MKRRESVGSNGMLMNEVMTLASAGKRGRLGSVFEIILMLMHFTTALNRIARSSILFRAETQLRYVELLIFYSRNGQLLVSLLVFSSL